jgi:hypothetical protein
MPPGAGGAACARFAAAHLNNHPSGAPPAVRPNALAARHRPRAQQHQSCAGKQLKSQNENCWGNGIGVGIRLHRSAGGAGLDFDPAFIRTPACSLWSRPTRPRCALTGHRAGRCLVPRTRSSPECRHKSASRRRGQWSTGAISATCASSTRSSARRSTGRCGTRSTSCSAASPRLNRWPSQKHSSCGPPG